MGAELKTFPGYKDGDDGDIFAGLNINIKSVNNGYVLDESDDEGDETYVFTNGRELIDHLKITLGV